MSWKKNIAVLLMTLAIPTSDRAANIVVPNALAGVEGNTARVSPFTGFGVPSWRQQQVYDASQFAALGPEGAFIEGIAFRLDTDSGQASAGLLRDVQINFSTTPRAPDNLSTNFAENVGADDTVVYGRSELHVNAAYSFNTRPQPFAIQITLEKPFFYRPSLGNLLFDLRIFTYSNSFASAFLDFEDVAGDSVSILFATNVLSSIGRPLSQGLVTMFFPRVLPTLNVVHTNANLEFAWIDRPEGYVMETSGNLSPTSSWQQVSAPGTTNGATRQIVLPVSTNIPSSFYRLKYSPVP